MNKYVLLEIIRKIKSKPHLKRKLKIFLIVGFVGFLLTGALAIWAGISAMKYVTASATGVIQSPEARTQMDNLTAKAKQGISRPQVLSCWNSAQSLLAIEPWILRPAMTNLQALIDSCLGTAPQEKDWGPGETDQDVKT